MGPYLIMPGLINCTKSPHIFFDFLPGDWRDEIEPFWPEFEGKARIYCLEDGHQVVAGGIVFFDVSPDTQGYADIARSWFDKGFAYMGFIYVDETRRSQGLGSYWIEAVRALDPTQRFWLAIDEYGLSNFYRKLGFEVKQEVINNNQPEWILAENSA